IYSSIEDEWNSKSKSRTLAESPAKKQLGRKPNMGKDDKKGATVDMDMDMDVNTPIPKRRVMGSVTGNEDVDLTPRPEGKPDPASWSSKLGLGAHGSVLAMARARTQGAGCVSFQMTTSSMTIDMYLPSGCEHQAKKTTASTSKTKRSSENAEWVSHMRYDP